MIVDLIYFMGRLPDNICSNIGIHLIFLGVKTSSGDDLPILINSAFADLKKERLALSKEHLNLHDNTINTPKYLMLSTQARGIPSAHNSSTTTQIKRTLPLEEEAIC